MKKTLLLLFFIHFILTVNSQTSYVWNGLTSTNWNTATNWTPNGIPGITDNANIVTGSNNCILSTNTAISSLTITSGVLNLNSFTLNSIGAVVCNGGTCSNGTFNALGSSLIFAGTTFNANITAAVTEVYFNGGIFNGSVSISKNGGSNAQSTGNNTFNGITSITNSGTGYLMMANGAVGRNDVFNGLTTFNTTNTGHIYVGYTRNATFNANITVNNTSSTGSTFLSANGGLITLGTGVTITCGSFVGATLNINKLIQSDATNLTLSTSTTGGVSISTSTITGNLNISAGNITAQSTTYNSNVVLNKTGGTSNSSVGGNTFNGTLTMNHSGVGYWGMGNGTRDVFNNDVFFNNTCANERIIIGQNSSNNEFNGNVNVTSGGSAQAIWLGFGGTAPVISIASGKTINVSPTTYSVGMLNIYGLVQPVATPLSYTVGTNAGLGIYKSTFSGPLTLTGGNIYTETSTFNDNITLNKTGGTSNSSVGGNTFNGTLTMNHSGIGYWGMGNGTRDVFNNDVFFNNTCANERIIIGQNSSNNEFNGNVNVTSGGSAQAIWLGFGGTAPVISIASGKTINVSPTTYSVGMLNIYGLVQPVATPLSYTVGTNAGLGIYRSTFSGPLSLTGGNIYTENSTFNGNVILNKNGGTNNPSVGGNVFNGTLTMNHSGVGYWGMGNGTRDVFNNDVFFNNTCANERILIGQNSSNNEFNGNVNVTSGGSAQAIWLGFGGTAPVISIASGKIINVSPTTYSVGMLNIYGLVQPVATPLSYTVGTNAGLGVYRSSFSGPLTLTGGNMYTENSTFNSNVILNKNGGTHNPSVGGNTFNGTLTMNHTGVGYWGMGNGVKDVFNNDVFFNNTCANERIIIGQNSSNNEFNGNVNVTSGGSAQAIWLGFGGTAPVISIASGKTINVSPTTYSVGMLNIYGLVQPVATPLSYTVGTNAGLGIYRSTFSGPLTLTGGNIYTENSTFNGNVILNKNGGTNNPSVGGNTFNGTLTMNHSGVGYWGMGNGTRDVFNSDVFFNNTCANERIIIGQNSTNNPFNGNVYVSSSGTAQNIWLGFGGGAYPVVVLASGKTVAVGSGGFTAGGVVFYKFAQSDATPISLTGTGTSAVTVSGNSTFTGITNFNAGNIYLNGGIFNAASSFTKTSTATNVSDGGNVFNNTTSVTNTGTGLFYLANTNSDAYNNDVIFTQNNTGAIYPNHATNCTYSGNVSVAGSGTYTITFGNNSAGIATFNGGFAQSISKSGSISFPTFTRLVVNKTSNDITLNTRINISSVLTLSQGIINTTSTNILNMNNTSNTTIGNSSSYINGPMNYDMASSSTRTLNFPIGKAADWRPAILNCAHSNATSYTYNAELTNASANSLGWTKPSSIDLTSLVHYWDITRSVTSTGVTAPTANVAGTQTITLFYDVNDGVTDPSFLTIVKNTSTAPTAWIDIGGNGATPGTGSVTSTSSPSIFNSYSRFTLGNKISGTNPLPVELLYFTATPIDNKTVNLDWATASEINNSYYDIERSIDGLNFEYLTTVKAYGNGNSVNKQVYNTTDEKPYKGLSYYRLKQVDISGEYKYANIVSVNISSKSFINFFPNPASDKLSYSASEDFENASITIINSVGAIVMKNTKLNAFNGSIDISNFANGFYFVIVQNNETVQNIKVNFQK